MPPVLKRFRFGLIAALVILALAGLSRISFNIDILKLLPSNLRQVDGLSLFLKNFALPDELIVTLQSQDSETAEAAADALADHLSQRPDLVKRAVSRAPWEKKPVGIAELLAYLLTNQSPQAVRELLDSLAPDKTAATLTGTLEKLQDSVSAQEVAMLSYDPYGLAQALSQTNLMSGQLLSEFASKDGTFRVIYVEAPRHFSNYKEILAWLNEVKALANRWNTTGRVTLGFTGEPAFVADISSTMEWDMMSSGFATLFIVALIFWVCYRRAKPLLWLVAMLVVIFILSLATAGLLLNQLTVMGVGFASIMIGLSVDYGYLIYQKSLEHTGSVQELRKICFQSLVWTSGTTAAAFFALNLSSMPGLSQLGNLVGIGVVIGAFVMLTFFVPIAANLTKIQPRRSIVERILASSTVTTAGFWATSAIVLALGAVAFFKGMPRSDFSSHTLRPRHSDAYDALDVLQNKLLDDRDLLSLIVEGDSAEQVRERFQVAAARLEDATARGDVLAFRSSLPLWVHPANQAANLPLLASLAPELPRLKSAAVAAGFKPESLMLTEAIISQWAAWRSAPLPVWPNNDASQWIFRRTVRHQDGRFLALGIVTPAPGNADSLANAVPSQGVHLVSWNLLGSQLKQVIPTEFLHVFAGLTGIVFALLFIGFRGVRDVLLLGATMGVVFLSLAGAMSLLGMEWNFFNLSAILLLLGTGIDYSILLILALRQNQGDIPDAQRQLGLVIVLCAAAATAGFGSISWANNLGLASLGKTCALGLLIDALISIFLLPRAWRLIHPVRAPLRAAPAMAPQP